MRNRWGRRLVGCRNCTRGPWGCTLVRAALYFGLRDVYPVWYWFLHGVWFGGTGLFRGVSPSGPGPPQSVSQHDLVGAVVHYGLRVRGVTGGASWYPCARVNTIQHTEFWQETSATFYIHEIHRSSRASS